MRGFSACRGRIAHFVRWSALQYAARLRSSAEQRCDPSPGFAVPLASGKPGTACVAAWAGGAHSVHCEYRRSMSEYSSAGTGLLSIAAAVQVVREPGVATNTAAAVEGAHMQRCTCCNIQPCTCRATRRNMMHQRTLQRQSTARDRRVIRRVACAVASQARLLPSQARCCGCWTTPSCSGRFCTRGSSPRHGLAAALYIAQQPTDP